MMTILYRPMVKEVLILLLSGVIAIVAYPPYVTDVLAGDTLPCPTLVAVIV